MEVPNIVNGLCGMAGAFLVYIAYKIYTMTEPTDPMGQIMVSGTLLVSAGLLVVALVAGIDD